MSPAWLEVRRGEAPLVVSFPHTGSDLPPDLERAYVSPWLARKDTDWWIDRLYDFATDLGATTVRTRISRSVIDVNRDPSGASLYPGQATTELCPLTTFDGETLYRGAAPDVAEISRRRAAYFEPYHAALDAELARLRARHGKVVLYEAHSIRSVIPRLFEGELPNFNLGTNAGASCGPALTARVEAACDASPFSRVTDGRFKGGWTTRRYGRPETGTHAIQMELACRGYMDEPPGLPAPNAWPPAYSATRAAPMRAALIDVLKACVAFAEA
ncbi:N-formylglutamate deformylase [Phenylobacterium hankyongense]|uniref:N-formylglutamate deformylase n=1 Tax=Phenylobacterium hankyongense TaxID=1813876 RepID=A0A328AWA9_9CAUL|nr:N-formylglutamate deformylase [Phenylobacterium hankyongense]RAK58461.1 N-formylglutamate deformylase [Phenylobacterium hankyongense]